MAKKPDPFELAEGLEALQEVIDQGPVQTSRRRRGRGLKEDWRQTNIRLDPVVKERAKAVATELGVPLEDVVHVALVRLLEALAGGDVELKARATATRQTLL